MTSNTVPAMLDALLQPLDSIEHELTAACILAEANKLPRHFLQTLRTSLATLGNVWETLNDTAAALNPDRGQQQPKEDPAMETIQAKLRSCYHLATIIRFLLHEALDLANDMQYDPHWIAAINTASQNNERVWLDTHNIATCIDPTAPIAPRNER